MAWSIVNGTPQLQVCGVFLSSQFRDAVSLRYDWELKNTPQTCSCGVAFTIDHAMICHTAGFPTIRHNEIRDITASLVTEVCHNVATEPSLQPLSGEILNHRTANKEDGARLDIRVRGFWNGAQDAFFDPNASTCRSLSLQAAFCRHEQATKREYGEHVRKVEQGVFTPLVLSTTGGSWLRSLHLLQVPGRSHQLKTTETLHQCHVLADMSPFICSPTICHHVCQESIIPPLPKV